MDKRLRVILEKEKKKESEKKKIDLGEVSKDFLIRLSKTLNEKFNTWEGEKLTNDEEIIESVIGMTSIFTELFDIDLYEDKDESLENVPKEHLLAGFIHNKWKRLIRHCYEDNDGYTVSNEWPDFKTFYNWWTEECSQAPKEISMIDYEVRCDILDPKIREYGPNTSYLIPGDISDDFTILNENEKKWSDADVLTWLLKLHTSILTNKKIIGKNLKHALLLIILSRLEKSGLVSKRLLTILTINTNNV